MFDGIELHTERLDLLRTHFASFKSGPGVFALTLGFSDFVAGRVLLAFEPLVFANQAAPQHFKRRDVGKGFVRIESTAAQSGADLFDVVPNEYGIEHAASAIDSICDLDTPLVRCAR